MQSQTSSAPTIDDRLDVWKAYRVASENKETGDSLSVFEDAARDYSAAHNESPEALGMVASNALHSGNWSTDPQHEAFIRDLFLAFDLTPELDSDEHK